MSDNPESNCAEIVIKEIRKSMEKVSNVELVDKEARPLLFNDYSTADTIIKLKPSNQLIFAHSSIISKSPFFEACKNFKESNGYIEITPPSESTTSTLLCIEFLYSYDSDLVNATSDIDHHVKSIIQSKFFADVFITAMYLQIDHLLKLCYERYFLVYLVFLEVGNLQSRIQSLI